VPRCHHRTHMDWLLGLHGERPATNRLRHGTTWLSEFVTRSCYSCRSNNATKWVYFPLRSVNAYIVLTTILFPVELCKKKAWSADRTGSCIRVRILWRSYVRGYGTKF
jgi:hypothetical protein